MIRTLLLAVWLMFMLAPASLAVEKEKIKVACICLLYTSPSPRDGATSRMPSSA